MNKDEFLTSLRKKLSILEESEIDDIISEYEGYIEEKIAKGSTEEEAVSSMGNLTELARDLLSAYKIKNPQDKTRDAFNNIADGCLNAFEHVIDIFAHKSFQEILRFVFEIACIFLIIAICKIPFEIIENFGRSAFYSLGGGAARVLSNIWGFVLEFVYLIFAILLFVKIFESRYLHHITRPTSLKKESDDLESSTKKNDVKKSNIYEEKQDSLKSENKEHHKGLIDTLAELCMLFVKMISFFILIGVIFYVVGMAITIGLSFYLMIRGVFYFGIYFILFSLFVLGIIAFIYLYNFIFSRKNKTGVLLIISLVCFVILGLGVGVCAIEFASTTIIYNEKTEDKAVETFTYTVHDNFVLSFPIDNGYNVTIDDSMGEEIKLEYTYSSLYYQIEAEPYVSKNGQYEVLYSWYHLKNFTYSKENFDKLIDDLKHKTLHIYDDMGVFVSVTMSQSSYDQLKSNYKKYRQYNHYSTDDLEEICEELQIRGLELPNYCNSYSIYQEM